MKQFESVDIGLLKKYSGPGPRYTSYPTAPVFTPEFGPRQYKEAIEQTNHAGSKAPLSLYFHFPYCDTLCYFCGCTMLVTNHREQIAQYNNYLPVGGGFSTVRAMGVSRTNEGTFEITGVQPGAYTLIVNRGGDEDRGQRLSARLPVQVGSRDLEGVVVQVQRTFEISGTIRVADRSVPLGGARVLIENLDSGLPFPGFIEATTKDGAFISNGGTPGRYRFTAANLPQGTYLKAVTANGQDITLGAEISAAASGIEVILGTNAPEVSGTVLNAEKQPAAGVMVVLVPETSKRSMYWLFRNAESGSGGEFTFRSLPPGSYTVYAMPGVEDGTWQDPEVLRQFEGRGVTVKLEEGSKENVQLTATS